jgi:hypothetical protein
MAFAIAGALMQARPERTLRVLLAGLQSYHRDAVLGGTSPQRAHDTPAARPAPPRPTSPAPAPTPAPTPAPKKKRSAGC